MAEGTTANHRVGSDGAGSGAEVGVENENKIPTCTQDSTVLYIQRGMSQLGVGNSNANYNNETNNNVTIANKNTIAYNNNNDNYNNSNSNINVGAKAYAPQPYYNNNSNYYENNSNYNNSNYSNYNNSYNNNMNANNNNSGVDSALLAAMRDPRERVALLRLERVMIDFINSSDGYLEVGGAFNSMVITPNKMTSTCSEFLQNNNTSSNSNTSNKNMDMTSQMGSAYGMRPATSFQRCLLHRLADRFGILRETGTIMEGSIRLVKQKDSKIPKQLLVNFPGNSYGADGQYEDYNGAGGSNGNGAIIGGGAYNAMDPRDPRGQSLGYNQSTLPNTAGQAGVTGAVALSGGPPAVPSNSASGPGGLTAGKSNSKRKMKIMKRMSSGADSAKSAGSGNATPKSRKNKNFSDKEKAYAEARARIFAGENPTPPLPLESGSTAVDTNGNVNNSSPSSSPPPSQTSESNAPMSKPSSCSSLGGQQEEQEDSNALSASATAQPPPVASTGMGIVPVKATLRNRRQEENDPDFQRGGNLLTQTIAATTAGAAGPIHHAHQPYNNFYAQAAVAAGGVGYPTHAPQHPAYPSTSVTGSGPEDAAAAAYYASYSKNPVGGRGPAAAVSGGRGIPPGGGGRGAGYTHMQQNSPRSAVAYVQPPHQNYQYRQYNPRAVPNQYNPHQVHHPHNHQAATTGESVTNLNCMEEFPALP